MCMRGLELPAPPKVASSLLEFSGISMAGLDFPQEMVRRAFEDARRVDPDNDRAGENLRRYLEGLAASKARRIEWDYPSSPSVRSEGERQILPFSGRRQFATAGT